MRQPKTATTRIAASVAGLAAIAFGLTACTDDQAYCIDLAGFAADAAGVNPQNPGDYTKILDSARKLSESAPSEVRDDWKTVLTFAEKAEKAKGNAAEMARLSRETGPVRTAYQQIASHAKETCKVDVPHVGE